MRVTGGRWRGRRLEPPPGPARPTTDRVRERLLALLGEGVIGAAAADLCCGGGALGIEALSRGAAYLELVDIDAAALRAAAANLARCGAAAGTWRTRRGDARRWLRREIAAPRHRWLVVADPPYRLGIAPALAELLARLAAAGGLRVAAVEHAAAEPLGAPAPPGWAWRERRAGSTVVSLLEEKA